MCTNWLYIRTTSERLDHFERYWIYYTGFGSPCCVLAFLYPHFFDWGLLSCIFPVAILTSITARPLLPIGLLLRRRRRRKEVGGGGGGAAMAELGWGVKGGGRDGRSSSPGRRREVDEEKEEIVEDNVFASVKIRDSQQARHAWNLAISRLPIFLPVEWILGWILNIMQSNLFPRHTGQAATKREQILSTRHIISPTSSLECGDRGGSSFPPTSPTSPFSSLSPSPSCSSLSHPSPSLAATPPSEQAESSGRREGRQAGMVRRLHERKEKKKRLWMVAAPAATAGQEEVKGSSSSGNERRQTTNKSLRRGGYTICGSNYYRYYYQHGGGGNVEVEKK
eukprot:GHVS01006885.1.p1 GENE.GHVS01006885.1~~GHVS01006885.1.p1  ORF type:complete len:337 (+),score=84.43 GHVS01006885.1:856-1866(+)